MNPGRLQKLMLTTEEESTLAAHSRATGVRIRHSVMRHFVDGGASAPPAMTRTAAM